MIEQDLAIFINCITFQVPKNVLFIRQISRFFCTGLFRVTCTFELHLWTILKISIVCQICLLTFTYKTYNRKPQKQYRILLSKTLHVGCSNNAALSCQVSRGESKMGSKCH